MIQRVLVAVVLVCTLCALPALGEDGPPPPPISAGATALSFQSEGTPEKKNVEETQPEDVTFLTFDLSLNSAYSTNIVPVFDNQPLPGAVPENDDFEGGFEGGLKLSSFFDMGSIYRRELGFSFNTSHLWRAETKLDEHEYAGKVYGRLRLHVPENAKGDKPGSALPVTSRGWYLGLDYDPTLLDGEDGSRVQSHKLTASVMNVWRDDVETHRFYNELDTTRVYYSIDFRDYTDPSATRESDPDGQYHTIGAEHQIYLAPARDLWPCYFKKLCDRPRKMTDEEFKHNFYDDQWLKFRLGYEFRHDRASSSDWTGEGNSVLFGLDVPLPHRLALAFDGELTWDDRVDFFQRYGIGLSYRFDAKKWSRCADHPEYLLLGTVRVGVDWMRADSWNGDSQDYDLEQAVFGIQVRFNSVPLKYYLVNKTPTYVGSGAAPLVPNGSGGGFPEFILGSLIYR